MTTDGVHSPRNETEAFDTWPAYLGKRVRVVMDWDPPRGTGHADIVGVLMAFGEDGTFRVRDDGGFMHYCWPCLDIQPAEDDS
jgi:hypothetical protein